jgi:ketosteroid isomerase-like protein
MNKINEEIIRNFYTAFSSKDAVNMIKYYNDDVVFEDPAFGVLKGDKAKNMWMMLCETAKDLKIDFEILSSSGDNVKAKWDAYYTFSRTGRKVHNKIEANFIIENGLIVDHLDTFNLHKWASQALGFSGKLIGWTGFFKRKLNAQTAQLLSRYMNSN